MESEQAQSSALTVLERNLGGTETIDVPVPSDELRGSIEEGDLVRVQDIPRHPDHFSTSYRRC